jgi:hypothetical protein
MRYYIIDTGREMLHLAHEVEDELKKEGLHYLLFLTDNDKFLGVEEVTEDEFLDLVKQSK